MTETILQEAERIINGPRRTDYGPVEESFLDIASRWTVELGPKLKEPLTAFDVAHLMVQMKLSRAKNGFHRDSYVDICGYAGLTEKLPQPSTDPEPFETNTVAVRMEDFTISSVSDILRVKNGLPRKWHYLNHEIPDEVTLVTDKVGALWWRREGGYWRRQHDGMSPRGVSSDEVSPFTEVIEEFDV